MLKEKSEAFEAFKKFRSLVEKEINTEVKMFRTNRGGEFCSNDFIGYCEKAGIARQFTAPYSPQQNGVVERRNRTVAAMTTSLLKGTKIPAFVWGEAVRHFIYLLNRLPYEAWKGKKPNLDHIQLFGCVAYMKIPQVYVKKLDDRIKAVV